MNRTELIERVKKLPFAYDKFWLVAGGAMVLYGFRYETSDLDLGCTSELADWLEDNGYPISYLSDGSRKIVFDDTTEIFENWLKGSIDFYEGIPVVSINGLIDMKRELRREKDLKDIELIYAKVNCNK